MKQVYTFGYSGKKPEQILRIAEQLNAVVFDARFSPRSRVPEWNGNALRQKWGDRYQHVKAFGNVNYKGGPVEIVDYAAGRDEIDNAPFPVILLMCVCADPRTCHRSNVAEMLRADGYAVSELPSRPARAGATSARQARLF